MTSVDTALRYCEMWRCTFSQRRNVKEDQSWVEAKKKHFNTDPDAICIFWRDSTDEVLSYKAESVMNFCRGVTPTDLHLTSGPAAQMRDAWLDDRHCSGAPGSGSVRPYSNRLSAAKLFQCLCLVCGPVPYLHLLAPVK